MTRDTNPSRPAPHPDKSSGADPVTAGDAALDRARAVSHRIAERCEQLTGETQIDHRPLPPDTTGGQSG
jgi:hypothetical protein